jgi:epidermal growth factor receptor substrate 15
MHLVYKALEKYTIPNMLPPELMPPSKRKESVQAATLPGAVPVLPNLVMGIDGTKVRVPPELYSIKGAFLCLIEIWHYLCYWT